MIKYFFVFIIGSLMMAFLGCKHQIRPDLLSIPEHVLKKTLPDSEPTDNIDIIANYAKINVGDTIVRSQKVDLPTDAARFEKQIDADSAKIFIHLNDNNDKTEHIYKTLRAAFERNRREGNPEQEILYLDLDELKRINKLFDFNQAQTNEFFLSMAKKINERMSSTSILLIKIDDLPPLLRPREFLALLPKPKLIVLSKKNFDPLQLFAKNIKSVQFMASGLRLSHMYQLMFDYMSTAPNQAVRNQAQAIALENAKIMGAINPHGTVAELAVFLKMIQGFLDGTRPSSDVKKDISRTLATIMNMSYPLVNTWNLNALSLAEVQKRVDDNPESFTGTSSAFRLAQKSIDEIRKVELPAIKTQTNKIAAIKEDVAAITPETSKIKLINDDTRNLSVTTLEMANKLDRLFETTKELSPAFADALKAIKNETDKIKNALPGDLGTAITDLGQKVDTVKTDLGLQLNTIKDDTTSLEAKTKNLPEALKAIQDETDKIKGIVIPDGLSGLQAIMTELSKKVEEVKNELSQQLSTVKTDTGAIAIKTEKFPDDIADILKKIQDETDKIKGIVIPDGLSDLQTIITDLGKKVEQVKTELSEQLSTVKTDTGAIVTKTEKLPEDTAETLKKIQDQTDKIPKNMHDLEKKIARIPDDLETLLSQINDIGTKIFERAKAIKDKTDLLLFDNKRGIRFASKTGNTAYYENFERDSSGKYKTIYGGIVSGDVLVPEGPRVTYLAPDPDIHLDNDVQSNKPELASIQEDSDYLVGKIDKVGKILEKLGEADSHCMRVYDLVTGFLDEADQNLKALYNEGFDASEGLSFKGIIDRIHDIKDQCNEKLR